MFGEIRYSNDMHQYECIYKAPSSKVASWIVHQYACRCGDNICLVALGSRVIICSRSEQAVISCKERLNLELASINITQMDENEDNNEKEDDDQEEDECDEEDEEDEAFEYKMPFHVSLNQMRLTRRSSF